MAKLNKSFDRKPNRPFPRHSLEEAKIIAFTVQDKNAGKPMKRLLLADAIGRKPTSPEFRDILSSSFKYGLTLGTEKAESIELTPLGKKLTKPTSSEIEIQARQEAVLSPEVFKRIYAHYKDAKLPKGTFFENTLESEFGIPRDHVSEVALLIEKNGRFSGIVRDISGSPHIMFDNVTTPENKGDEESEESINERNEVYEVPEKEEQEKNDKNTLKPIFIAHGKDKKPLEQLKRILDQFKIPYKIAVDEPNSGRPISQKVREIMKECGSAIFIFSESGEPTEGENVLPNINVVFELGAASVLYEDKIIIFKEEKVNLSSDFRDLCYIPYDNGNLSAKAMDLLKELIQLGFVKIAPAN